MTEKDFLPSENSGPALPVRKPMDNMADSDRYLAWREQCAEVFGPDCRTFRTNGAEERQLDRKRKLNIRYYEGEVSGCFWACPASVMLMDFSRPLTANGSWVILHDAIDDGYDVYDDIEFTDWGDSGSLTVICYNVCTSAKETLVFDAGQVRKLLAEH